MENHKEIIYKKKMMKDKCKKEKKDLLKIRKIENSKESKRMKLKMEKLIETRKNEKIKKLI